MPIFTRYLPQFNGPASSFFVRHRKDIAGEKVAIHPGFSLYPSQGMKVEEHLAQ